MQVARNFFLTREKTRHPQAARGAARLEDRGQSSARTRFSSSTSTRSSSASARTASPPRRRSTSASRSRTSPWPRRRCWPGCPRRRRPTTRSPIRKRAQDPPALRAAADARSQVHHRRPIRGSTKRATRRPPGAARNGAHACRIRRRNGAPGRVRCVRRRGLYPGLTVYTTIRKADQEAAYAAVRRGVIDYDRRHGYRGPEAFVSLPDDAGRARRGARTGLPGHSGQRQPRPGASCSRRRRPRSRPCIADGEALAITGDGLKFAARSLRRQGAGGDRGSGRGAVIRVARDDKGRWAIAQMPQVESSVRLDAPHGRRDPLAGRRLRLRPQQVQPRDPGAAPARIGLQALHLFGGAGEGLHARRPSSTTRRSSCRGAGRRRGLGAQELRRQVRRPDAPAHRARASRRTW